MSKETRPEEDALLHDTNVTVTKEGRALFTLDDMLKLSSNVFGTSKHEAIELHFICYEGKIYVASSELAAITGRKKTGVCSSAINYCIPKTRKFAVAATYGKTGTTLKPSQKGKYRSLLAKSISFIELKDVKTFLEKQKQHFYRLRDFEKEAVPCVVTNMIARNRYVINPHDPLWRKLAYIAPDATFLGLKPSNKPCPIERKAIQEITASGWTPQSGEKIHLWRNGVWQRVAPKAKKTKVEPPQQEAAPKEAAAPQPKEEEHREEVTITVPRGTIVHIKYES